MTVNNTPPTTAVIVPANSATVSGTASTLDATASAASRARPISKVQFVLTGGSYNKTVIGTATATIYGYVVLVEHHRACRTGPTPCRAWPPTAPANTAYSARITVTVSNTPPTTAVIVPANNATVSGTSVDARRHGQRRQRA